MGREVGPVGHDASVWLGLQRCQRRGEGHIAEAVVVTVRFAVRRDVRQPVSGVAGYREQARSQKTAVVEEIAEGNVARQRTIVEEEHDRATGRELHAVGTRRIDAPARNVLPGSETGGAHCCGLVWREDSERDAHLRDHVERGQIDRGFR